MRPVTTRLESGAEVAGFRVEGLIAEGGMGTVYRATQLRLDREVALKVLSPERGLDPEFRERFIRESKVAGSLDHPNVLPVYDAGEADGVTYLAMRYVEGGDLRGALREHGRLPVALALEITRQIANALEAAHRAGLVHRDVKPANILLAAEDHAYLADFGLARSESARGLTHSGAFMGSPDYVSPEQVEGVSDVDGRADIYSLGCVLYHCLAGQPPYGRQSEIRALMAHLHEPTPLLSQVRPDLPDGVSAIAAKAMAKDRAERYPTGADLAAALSDLLGDLRLAGAPAIDGESAGDAQAVVLAPLGPTQIVDRFDAHTEFAPTAIGHTKRRSVWRRSLPVRKLWAVAGAGALLAAVALVAVLIAGGGSSGPEKPLASAPELKKPLAVTAVTVADHSASGGYDRRVRVSFVTSASPRRPVKRVEFWVKGLRKPRSGTLATIRSPAFISRLTNDDPYRIKLRACNKRGCSVWSSPWTASIVPFGPPFKPRIVSARARGERMTFRWQSQSNGRPVKYLLKLKRKGVLSKSIHLGTQRRRTVTVGYAVKGSAIVCAADPAKSVSCSSPWSFLTPRETYRETTWIVVQTRLNSPYGPKTRYYIGLNGDVQIACRVTGPIPPGSTNPWWYRIASRDRNITYYASAEPFYNDKQTSGIATGRERHYDPRVPTCDG